MLSALDDSVGNVTRALYQRGMLNNTIIVFSTDNGGPADGYNFNDASNWPLRSVTVTYSFILRVCLVCVTVLLFIMPPTTGNNNNNQDNVYGAVIMAEPLREFTRFI